MSSSGLSILVSNGSGSSASGSRPSDLFYAGQQTFPSTEIFSVSSNLQNPMASMACGAGDLLSQTFSSGLLPNFFNDNNNSNNNSNNNNNSNRIASNDTSSNRNGGSYLSKVAPVLNTNIEASSVQPYIPQPLSAHQSYGTTRPGSSTSSLPFQSNLERNTSRR